MNIQEVCRKIYEIALPVCQKSEAPIAYISVILSRDFPFAPNVLYEEFNRVKWNTPLSSSELDISQSQTDAFSRVVSVTEFEDENGEAKSHETPESIF